ncbi:MAG: tRNA 2-thiouridine synthesizing protein [Actinomycetota bacterium]|nr:tRNA 2-thiouridine synthesizing protein [Actinomycetota bacterium]
MTGPDSQGATLDERGHRCPAPIIALGRYATTSVGDEVVTLLADDPAAQHDVPAWCRLRGAKLIAAEPVASADGAGWTRYTVRMPPPNVPGSACSPGNIAS